MLNGSASSVANTSEALLLQAIAAEFDQLSRQLKLIAHYVEQHRAQLGIQSIHQVAANCGVQPSAVIRFAKHFGFSGYTAMQKLFRDGLAQQISPGRSYQARIRSVIESGARNLGSEDIARAVIEGVIAGTEELQRTLPGEAFNDAVKLLFEADAVWLMASRRAFAVAVYLTYALQHTDKRVQNITSFGSMQEGQLHGLRAADVMLAISFAPYSEETERIVRLAHERGATIIVITDSNLSQLARLAQVTLLVSETSVFGFRALTNTMTMAQSLFMALAYRLELQYPNVSPRRSARADLPLSDPESFVQS